jgi:hypothetical protein
MATTKASETYQIIQELISLQERNNNFNLVQFESRVGADQYLPVYRFIKKTIPLGSKVLDWGCGEGHFSYFLCRSG